MSPKQKSDKVPEKLPHKIIKWGFRLVLCLMAFIFLVSISLVIIFNIPSFRAGLIKTVLSFVNTSLEGKIEIDDIKFNGFAGLEVDGFRLLTAGDTLAQAKMLTVDFELWDLLKNKLLIYNLTLDQPNIKLLRQKSDSSWNFEHISKPTEKKPPSQTKWFIDLRNIKLVDGHLFLYDSTSNLPNNKNLNFSFLDLQNLNIFTSATADLGTNTIKAALAMKFQEKFSGLIVNEFSIRLTVDTNKVLIPNLKLLTDKSNVDITFAADSMNIFKGITNSLILHQDFSIHIKGDSVDIGEVKKIGAFDALLSPKASIDASFHGNLSDLDIDDMELKTGQSHLKFHGNIVHPTEPDKLFYNVFFDKAKFSYKDILEFIPKETHKSLPLIDLISLENSYFAGGVDTASANINLTSSAGRFKGMLIAAGFAKDIHYMADLNVVDINLAKITRDTSKASSITGKVNITGRGTDLKTMITDVRMDLENSTFGKYAFNTAGVGFSSSGTGKFIVDSLNLSFVKDIEANDSLKHLVSYGNLSATGWVDIANKNEPKYDLTLKMNKLNFAELGDLPDAPSAVSGMISFSGEGLKPDSIKCRLTAAISECNFKDRMLFPFEIKMLVNHDQNDNRNFEIESDFLKLELKGKYNFSSLLKLVENQGMFLGNYINKRIAAVTGKGEKANNKTLPAYKTGRFIPVNFKLDADIKDVSLVNIFMGDNKLLCVANVSLNLNVTETNSILKIDSIAVKDFDYKSQKTNIFINPLLITGGLEMSIKDSVPTLTNFDLTLEKSTEVYINDLELKNIAAKVNLLNDIAGFDISTLIDDQYGIKTKGSLYFSDTSINVSLPDMEFTYQKSLTWNAVHPIECEVSSEGINLKSFQMKRKDAEVIDISGKMKDSIFNNVNINISDMPFKIVSTLVPSIEDYVSHYDFNVKTMQFKVNGAISNPDIDFDLITENIRHRRDTLAFLGSSLKLRNSVLTGDVMLMKNIGNNPKKLLTCQVISLPLNFGKEKNNSILSSLRPTSLSLEVKDLPLSFLSHFIRPVENLSGNADATLSIEGYAPDKLDYTGSVQMKNAAFTLRATNITYNTEASMTLKKDSIIIDKFLLKNTPDDMVNGIASIKGSISLKDFSPDEFNLTFQSRGLKVLSQATYKAMPNLYGDFVISTDIFPLKFYGTLRQPVLSGDIDIIKADLSLPNTTQSNVSESIVVYEYVNNHIKISVVSDSTLDNKNQKDSLQATESKTTSQQDNENIADLMTYNLKIKIVNSVIAKIDLGDLGEVYAEIASSDPLIPLQFKQFPHGSPNLVGEIVLKDNSSYKLYGKFLSTTGKINFQSGYIDNPGLDLTAVYAGRNYLNDNFREYTVILHIMGTKNNPRITFDYTIDNKPSVGDSSTVLQDAIFLLLFGRTKSEMIGGQGQGGNIMNGAAVSAANALVSKSAADLLTGSLIRSADIDFANGSFDKARINLSGQLFGDVSWRFGGTVADITNSNEFSIDMPLRAFTYPGVINNVILQLTKSTYFATPTNRNQKNWEFKIKVGNSW